MRPSLQPCSRAPGPKTLFWGLAGSRGFMKLLTMRRKLLLLSKDHPPQHTKEGLVDREPQKTGTCVRCAVLVHLVKTHTPQALGRRLGLLADGFETICPCPTQSSSQSPKLLWMRPLTLSSSALHQASDRHKALGHLLLAWGAQEDGIWAQEPGLGAFGFWVPCKTPTGDTQVASTPWATEGMGCEPVHWHLSHLFA